MDAAVILGTSLHEPIGRIQRVSAVMLWCCQLNSIFSPESSAATVGTQAARITVRLASGGIKRFLVQVQKHAAHKVTPSGGLGRSWAATCQKRHVCSVGSSIARFCVCPPPRRWLCTGRQTASAFKRSPVKLTRACTKLRGMHVQIRFIISGLSDMRAHLFVVSTWNVNLDRCLPAFIAIVSTQTM